MNTSGRTLQKKYIFKFKIPDEKDLPKKISDELLEVMYRIDEFSWHLVNEGIIDKEIAEMGEKSEAEFLITEYEKNNIVGSPLFDEIIKSDNFKNIVRKKTDYLWLFIAGREDQSP